MAGPEGTRDLLPSVCGHDCGQSFGERTRGFNGRCVTRERDAEDQPAAPGRRPQEEPAARVERVANLLSSRAEVDCYLVEDHVVQDFGAFDVRARLREVRRRGAMLLNKV
jgi:hypothetical protein